MVKSILLLAAALAVSLHSCTAAPEADRVLVLPGLQYQPSFNHYSGYLKAGGDRHLHYWLVESSQIDASKAPLVLWFNGGPGCSSMEGFLREHGPFIVNDMASLDVNPYAWNRQANVLYIEAPAGVGFSYSEGGVTKTNDTQTAMDNYLALKDFMRKFPEFQGRELHISGESYGGVYVPTLALKVLQDSSLKLKSIIIGNGLTSWRFNSLTLLYFGYYHGLLGDQLWSNLRKYCCDRTAGERCDFYAGKSRPNCAEFVSQAENTVTAGLDIYNLYKPCHGGSSILTERVSRGDLSAFVRMQVSANTRSVSKKELTKKYFFESGFGHSNQLMVGVDPPCTNDTAISTYLDMPVVRYALHVKDKLPPFTVCANIDYTNIYKDMTSVYQQLIKAKLPITLYNGDVDMACSFLQTDWFLQNLNMTTSLAKKAWYYQHPTEGKQIGGYVQQWTSGVTFLTVRGSGHMVPEDKPVQAYQLFMNYLHNSGW